MQFQKSVEDAHKLLQLLALVEASVKNVIKAWAHPASPHGGGIGGSENLATRELFDAQRILLAAAGMLTELVATPSARLLEVSSQYNESRALHIAAALRIPDILAGDAGRMSVDDLSSTVGVESRKLCRFVCPQRAYVGLTICSTIATVPLLDPYIQGGQAKRLCKQCHFCRAGQQ